MMNKEFLEEIIDGCNDLEQLNVLKEQIQNVDYKKVLGMIDSFDLINGKKPGVRLNCLNDFYDGSVNTRTRLK